MGGDTFLARRIASMLPEGEVFIEAFGGAGSVTLYLAKHYKYDMIIWNDINPAIYSAFHVIKNCRKCIDEIYQNIMTIVELLRNNEKEQAIKLVSYYRDIILHGIMNPNVYPLDVLGIATIVFHYTASSPVLTGYRIRPVQRSWNFSKLRNKLLKYHELLQKVIISNTDGVELLRQYDTDGVVAYVDPPHMMENRQYYHYAWSKYQAVRLENTLLQLRKLKVLLKLSPPDQIVYKRIRTWNRREIIYRKYANRRDHARYVFYANYDYPDKEIGVDKKVLSDTS